MYLFYVQKKGVTYFECGLKNKRRTMEDKVALYENTNIFLRKNGNGKQVSLFGVFDGHCGIDCAHYISSHLPLYIIQQPEFELLHKPETNHELTNSLNKLFTRSFKIINERITEKAQKEVNKSFDISFLSILSNDRINF